MDAPIHHNINSDTIFINNRNDNSDAHINISTKGALGDNDLHLKDCNVELDSGFVKAPTMKTTSIQDINGNNCLTMGANSIDFHNKAAANLSLGVGSISANSVTSENGYASLDAELDALTTNKVSITGHTPSKIFVSSGGGGITTSSVASSQLSNIATNTASISTINSNYVSKSADSLIDLATLTVGDDPDGNNGGIQLRRVVNLGLGQVAFGKLKLPSITANKEYTFPDDTCVLAKKASVDTNVSSISTNTSSISTNTSNISTNASNISSNTSNITTNASGISTNTSNISTNTSNISTNASGISTNTSTILINASSISTNASGIATNVTNITANTNKLAPITNLNGNIGIGETFPNKLLTLHNSSRVDIKFDTGDEDHYIRKDGDYLRFRGHDDSTILFELQNNNSVTNHSKPSNNICCFPSGNVGIGTSSPSRKLQVAGDVVLGYIAGTNDGLWMSNSHSSGVYGTSPFIQGVTSGFGTKNIALNPNGGNVGIGTNSPNQKLHVSGSATINGVMGLGTNADTGSTSAWNSTAYIQDSGGHHTQTFGQSDQWRVSLKAYYSIWSVNGVIGASSDERIKENIQEIDDSYSLKKVRDINCVWYNYKDKAARGGNRVAGFIAQQVREHLPEAVSVQNGVIPNEMRNLEDISWNGQDMTCQSLSDVSGVKYRFYVSNNDADEEMKEIIGNEDSTFTFDASYNNVFCYGKEVDDFNILDKQKLFALNFSATQELDRKVIALQQENDVLKARLTILESKINLSS